VVVLENIFRHQQELKEPPHDAAIQGTNEVSSAVFAGTVTTLVIFLPLIFVEGVAGVLFKELAYVIMFSLFCSLLVALSLVPMISSRFLRSHTSAAPGKLLNHLGNSAGRLFDAMEHFYHELLVMTLKHRWLTVGLSVLLFLGSLSLVNHIGTEFIPPSDEGEVRISGEMEVGTRLDLIDRQTRILEQQVYPAVPEAVSSVVSVISSGTWGRSKGLGEIRLSLNPAAERQRSNEDIAADLRKLLDGRVPGMKIRVRAPKGQFLLNRILSSDEGLTVEVRGYDLDTLELLGRQVTQSIQDIDGITDVEFGLEAGLPQQEIRVNRERISDLGLTVRDVSEVIETAVAGSQAGEYRVAGNSYRILVQLADAERRSIDEILDLTLSTADGQRVALRNLVTTQSGFGPVTIERKDQQRLITVSANISGRDLGSVSSDIQNRLDRIARPPGYDLLITGSYQEQQKSYRELTISLVLALVLVYMVLASQYESLIDPLVVMLSVPLAAIGVILTLFITDTTLNLQSAIGCIMLGGIVVNNAILLVDQANRLRLQNTDTMTALLEAGRRRLRPVLMTSLTTILALLPLALGVGEGADAQAPLARAVVGGLLVSTFITLLLVPAVYSIVHPQSSGQPSDKLATYS
jgi:HAE1 family hydrophobic/amphiphilic exporter-1